MELHKQQDLRPIEIGHGYTKIRKAFFHQWFKKVDEDGGEYVWAIVELEDGRIHEEGAAGIKFLDRQLQEA